MGKSQRTKGAVFEREVCDIFGAALGRKIQRNIGQSRDGGYDIDIGLIAAECKRRKTLGTVYAWLQQAIDGISLRRQRQLVADAPLSEPEIKIPIVVAREDNGAPIVILRLSDFLILTRDEITASL